MCHPIVTVLHDLRDIRILSDETYKRIFTKVKVLIYRERQAHTQDTLHFLW